jgi:GTP-binding protein
MLKDKVVIKIEAGNGGKGSIATRNAKTNGGNGGDGGSVFLKGSTHLYDLGRFNSGRTYKAERGNPGLAYNRKGTDGTDLYIEVPLVTEVYEKGNLIAKISEHGEEVIVAKGGLGGFGNTYMKKHDEVRVTDNLERIEGEIKTVEFVLKLQADVIFIGYPNAGKSSILNALTKREVKTAPYAFTTLDPQIGLMDSLRLMDLPGLIEGSHEGKGVGTKFVKHTENSELIAHFISSEESDPIMAYRTMKTELDNIDPQLNLKKEIVIITKTDELEDQSEISKLESLFINNGIDVVSCTILDDESVEKVANRFHTILKK